MTRKALLPLLGFAVAFTTASFAAEINYKTAHGRGKTDPGRAG